jgi:hypothetical protein
VLQRNTSGYPIELPTLGLGRLIHPGEDFDHETRLAGFTPVEELDNGDAAGGEPGDEKPATESASDTETSDDTPSSGAPSPVGQDQEVDSPDVPVGDLPAPAATSNAKPLTAEEA